MNTFRFNISHIASVWYLSTTRKLFQRWNNIVFIISKHKYWFVDPTESPSVLGQNMLCAKAMEYSSLLKKIALSYLSAPLNKTCVFINLLNDITYSLHTVYPKKYAHGFVVLCFVVVMQSFIIYSHEVFIHIHQDCFAGTWAIVRLPQCQWSKSEGYGKISQCITTTKHGKAKTVCIFLRIYCISPCKLIAYERNRSRS